MNDQFLNESGATKRRWRDAASEELGISPKYYWLGNGRDGLEVAYGSAVLREIHLACDEFLYGVAEAPFVPAPGIVDHLGCVPRCDERVKIVFGAESVGRCSKRFVLSLIAGPKEPVATRSGRGVG